MYWPLSNSTISVPPVLVTMVTVCVAASYVHRPGVPAWVPVTAIVPGLWKS